MAIEWTRLQEDTDPSVSSVARRVAKLQGFYQSLDYAPIYRKYFDIVRYPKGVDTSKPPGPRFLESYSDEEREQARLTSGKSLRSLILEGYPVSADRKSFSKVWLRPCDIWRIDEYQPEILGQMAGWEIDLHWAVLLALPVNRRKSTSATCTEPTREQWDRWIAPSEEQIRTLTQLSPEEEVEVLCYLDRLVTAWSTINALRGLYPVDNTKERVWTAAHSEMLSLIWDTNKDRYRQLEINRQEQRFVPPTRKPKFVVVRDAITRESCPDLYQDLILSGFVYVQENQSLELTPSGLLALMLASGKYQEGSMFS